MISGTVNARREAVIPLTILRPAGNHVVTEAIIDTGFTGSLTLPAALVTELELPWLGAQEVILGDGTVTLLDVHAAMVLWDGAERTLEVSAAGVEPLVGMTLLDGYELRVEVTHGGTVSVRRL